ncbi:MAG: hypothetical protein IRY85_11725 [Micromonosporaceae bacterium]|nr:hypothetical protein [Micromonosporaceae bacterium]
MRIRNIILPVAASLALLAGCAQTPSSEPTPTTTPTPEYNGVQDMDADAIWQAALDALADAQSYRLKGKGEDNGQPMEIDAVFAGDLAKGTISISGLELEVIVTEDGGYVRGTEDFWRANLPAEQADLLIPLLGSRYMKLPLSEIEGFIVRPEDLFDGGTGLTKGEITEYKGQPAITVKDSEGNELYVALVGEPYPLASTSTDGTLEFLNIDEAVTIEAPPADQVFDATQFLS